MSAAKRRLADEYDAAQDRGDVASQGRPKKVPDGKPFFDADEIAEWNGEGVEQIHRAATAPAKIADIEGLSKKDLHDARQLRDAEQANPGITRRAIDGLIARGEEPTRAAVKREIIAAPPKTATSYCSNAQNRAAASILRCLSAWQAEIPWVGPAIFPQHGAQVGGNGGYTDDRAAGQVAAYLSLSRLSGAPCAAPSNCKQDCKLTPLRALAVSCVRKWRFCVVVGPQAVVDDGQNGTPRLGSGRRQR